MASWNKVTGVVLASVLAFGGLRAVKESSADDKKKAAVDEVFADLTKAGFAGMRAGSVPGREDPLFERIWAGES